MAQLWSDYLDYICIFKCANRVWWPYTQWILIEFISIGILNPELWRSWSEGQLSIKYVVYLLAVQCKQLKNARYAQVQDNSLFVYHSIIK